MKTETAGIEARLRASGEQLHGLEQLVKTKTDQSVSIDAQISSLNDRRTAAENQVSDVEARLASLLGAEKKTKDILGRISEIEREKTGQEKRLQALKEDISDLLDTKAETDAILQAKKGLEDDYLDAQSRLTNSRRELESAEQEMDELEGLRAWRGYLLSAEALTHNLYWDDLRSLIQIQDGKAEPLKPYQPQMEERVRKKMVELYARMVKDDVVSTWQHQRVIQEKTNLQSLKKLVEQQLAEVQHQLHDTQEQNSQLTREKENLTREKKGLTDFLNHPEQLKPEQIQIVKDEINRYTDKQAGRGILGTLAGGGITGGTLGAQLATTYQQHQRKVCEHCNRGVVHYYKALIGICPTCQTTRYIGPESQALIDAITRQPTR